MKSLVSLSGGLDSSTLVGYLKHQTFDVQAIHFQYGSKHNKYELEAAKQINDFYKLPPLIIINLNEIFSNVSSNLLSSGGDIPEGHYASENMKLTVVPGRNLIFASILSSIAESNRIDVISLAVHQGDHAIYPDCRPDFINSLRKTIKFSTERRVTLFCPFINKTKTDIVTIGLKIGVPYNLTRTCYKDQENACGKCGACNERLESFKKNNFIDPISYEN